MDSRPLSASDQGNFSEVAARIWEGTSGAVCGMGQVEAAMRAWAAEQRRRRKDRREREGERD